MGFQARIHRPLGTMVAFGFERLPFSVDLELATRMGASVVEILPDWESNPDPRLCRRQVVDAGLKVHSAHGSWGRRSFSGARVDLGSTDEAERRESVEQIKRCADWLAEVGGRHLVVHPGGISRPEERAAREDSLGRSLIELAEHTAGGGPLLCVENMPPGVHPGSRVRDLFDLLTRIGRPELKLIVDTGHAQLSASVEEETIESGNLLASLHVHDNNGLADLHLPPGDGVIDWVEWRNALDRTGYSGPIMLECIRQIRHTPNSLCRRFLTLLADLTSDPLVEAAVGLATS